MSPTNLKRAFASFFTPSSMIPFIFGAIIVGVLGNSVFQMLTNILGTQNSSLIGVCLLTVLVFFLAMAVFIWRESRPPIPPLLPSRAPNKHRGLVFLFSRLEPCETAVRFHLPNLKRLWLICSPQTNEAATAAATQLSAQHGLEVEVRLVKNVYDPLECYQRVQEIYTNLPDGMTIYDVIADYTGMTAHASIGMTLACLHLGAPLEYTPGRFVDPTQPPVGSDPPFEVVLQGRRMATRPT